jgi:LysR family glycine cleavage system transcriptional activator
MVAAMVTRPAPARPPRRARKRPIQLASLRGFESAGRLLSFTAAAAELNLTQSSISRQVAAVERDVGKRLFLRKTRALELTNDGERLLRVVRQALATIDRTVDEVRGLGGPPRVSVATYASFASLWLVPRLATFQRLHPEIEIRIDAADRRVDLEAEGMDLAIRWVRPDSAPSTAHLLHEEEITPAVSPDLIARTGVKLDQPADLLQLPLLEMDDDAPTSNAGTWVRWFTQFGVPFERGTPAPAGKLLFTFVDQSVQAAVRGQGAIIGRTPFLDDLLAAGALVTPFSQQRMRTGYCFFLLENPSRRDAPHVQAFKQWLLEEFRRGPRRET